MNPNQAKKNTLPYLLAGLRIGIERAFPLTGFISGACQRVATLNPILASLSCRMNADPVSWCCVELVENKLKMLNRGTGDVLKKVQIVRIQSVLIILRLATSTGNSDISGSPPKWATKAKAANPRVIPCAYLRRSTIQATSWSECPIPQFWVLGQRLKAPSQGRYGEIDVAGVLIRNSGGEQ